jgi:hypothetical protein
MANLTLAPEDDDPDFPRGHDVRPSPREATDPMRQVKPLTFHDRFDPHKIGFGLLPWPGVDASGTRGDNVGIAIQYLMDGTVPTIVKDKK